MSNPTPETLRRLLTELANTAEHASLTRSLAGGEKAAARTFNGALATLTAQGLVPDGMFQSLSLDEADYGTLGVQSRLLIALLGEPEPRREKGKDREGGLGALVALAPFLDSRDLSEMVRERLDESRDIPDGVLTALAPFLDSHHLGDLVRRRTRPDMPPTPPTPPVPPTPPSYAGQMADLDANIAKIRRLAERTEDPEQKSQMLERADTLERQVDEFKQVAGAQLPVPAHSEAPVTLESLATELRRPDLTIEERQRIAMQLAELSYEQSVKALD